MNTRIYGQLLSETVPAVITSDKEYDRIEELFANMINKVRSPEEDKLFDLLADILENYDRKVMPEIKRGTPLETLNYLIKENNLRQIDLVDIFSSQGIVSEVLSGKRQITVSQAKKLAKRFKLSVEAFI
ncbi:MAG: helix-turn-helix domain-containing protein [Aridibacter sp.]